MKREEVFHPAHRPEPGAQAVAEAVEKRQHPRVPVSLDAEIIEPRTHVRITGRATDFGVGGCYVDTLNTFAKGTEVEVRLHWEDRTLHLRALVSYTVHGHSIGMGLSFIGTSDDQGANLLDWVTSLGRQPAPEPARTAPAADGRTSGETRLARTHRLEEILDELVTLLVRKQVLSETEGAEIRDRISA